MSSQRSSHKPYRLEPVVVDPGSFLDHSLEAPLWEGLQPVEQDTEELIERAHRALDSEKSLPASLALQVILHPDERVLLGVLRHSDFSPPYQLQLDVEPSGLRMRDMLKLLRMTFSGHNYRHSRFNVKESLGVVREDYGQKIAHEIRVQLWKRALRSAQTEGVYWTPLLDQLHTPSTNKKIWTRFKRQLKKQATRLGEWLDEEGTRVDADRLLAFDSPHIISMLSSHAHLLSPSRIPELLEKDEATAHTILSRETGLSTEALHYFLDWIRAEQANSILWQKYLRKIATHPQANSHTWKIVMDIVQEWVDRGKKYRGSRHPHTFQPGFGFHKSEGWMQHPPSRDRYVQHVSSQALRSAFRGDHLTAAQLGSSLLRVRPQLLAMWLADPEFEDTSLQADLRSWVQTLEASKLTPLLSVEEGEYRQNVLMLLARDRDFQEASRRQRSDNDRRTSPFQPRESSR